MTPLANSWARDAHRVAVVGAGTMGEGIAQSFAEAGLAVRLLDLEDQALDRCRRQIAINLDQAQAHGIVVDTQAILACIEFVRTDDVVKHARDCELVVETTPEVLELKRRLFATLDALPPSVILASNTSGMTMGSICEGMNTEHRAIGLHYFNPAHIIPTVEVHRSRKTAEDTVASAVGLLRRVGKVPLVVRKEIPGFVINRLTGALSREIAHLLDEGVVEPAELDAAVRGSLGFRLAWVGPMEGADFIGLDTDARVSAALFGQLSNRSAPPAALLEKVREGQLGVKSGAGWYDYGGRSREDLLTGRNARLLRQLKAFREEPEP